MAVVFGVFDRLHDGHRFFLHEVQSLLTFKGHEKKITVVVTPDIVVERYKGKNANRQTQDVRCVGIESFDRELYDSKDLIITSVIGDLKEGEYSVLREPSSVSRIICLGYDQHALLKDLTDRMNKDMLPRLPIIVINSFQPEKLHTSILFPNKELLV